MAGVVVPNTCYYGLTIVAVAAETLRCMTGCSSQTPREDVPPPTRGLAPCSVMISCELFRLARAHSPARVFTAERWNHEH